MAGIGKAIAGDEEPQAGQDPQAGQEPGQPAPEGQQDDGDQANVSPEEQAAYDEFVTNGMKLIYQGDHVAPAVLDQLKGNWKASRIRSARFPGREAARPGNPIDDLSVATVSLVLALEASAANSARSSIRL
jgi:hypothetical protein